MADSDESRPRCDVQNEFHESTDGCSVIKTANNRAVHIFNKTKISLAEHGEPLYLTINHLGDGIEIKYTSINSIGGRVCTLLPRHYQNIETYLTTGEKCVQLMIELKRASDVISDCLAKKQGLENIVLSTKSLFDCLIRLPSCSTQTIMPEAPLVDPRECDENSMDTDDIEDEDEDHDDVTPMCEALAACTKDDDNEDEQDSSDLLFYRPTSFTNKTELYYSNYQGSLFSMFLLTSQNIVRDRKLHKTLDNLESCMNALLPESKRGKNQKTCNAAYFVAHPSELIDCRAGTKDMCPHILEYEEMLQRNEKVPASKVPRCKKLWKKLQTEGKLSSVITFKCLHTPQNSVVIQEYFGRSHRVHTLLCFPKDLLDSRWLDAVMLFLQQRQSTPQTIV